MTSGQVSLDTWAPMSNTAITRIALKLQSTFIVNTAENMKGMVLKAHKHTSNNNKNTSNVSCQRFSTLADSIILYIFIYSI